MRGARALAFLAGVVYAFLLLPIVVVVLAALNAGDYLTFPPQGFSLRWFVHFAQDEAFTHAFAFSLELAALATAFATVLGTLAALYVARHARRAADALRVLFVAPLQFPAILTGVALLIFFYALHTKAQGTLSLVVGHTIICIPYVFLAVSVVLAGFDRSLEEAARGLGASPFATFRRVTLPIIGAGVASGAAFAFINSFGEFPVSLMLAGVGATPLPIELFDYLRFDFDPTAAAVGTVNIAMATVVVLVTERIVGLEVLYRGRR